MRKLFFVATLVLVTGAFASTAQAQPTACFDWECDHSTAECDFDASCSTGTVVWQFDWDFGNGTGETNSTPLAYVDYTQSGPYAYDVTLTVTDAFYNTDEVTCEVLAWIEVGGPWPDSGRCQ